MVTAYWEQPLLQDDIARWLGTTRVGTPSSHVERLARRGFEVTYRTGSLADLAAWLDRRTPCILFVRTGDLPYWKVDTPHAVVIVGLEADYVYLLDPATDSDPISVAVDNLMLAWSHSDYTYAALSLPPH